MIVKALQRRLHYAWVVAAVTFLALITSAGMRATPGVLIVPLQHEFGWSRATITVAISINLVLFGLCGPFAAALMDRFGMRKIMVVAMLSVATAAFLTIFMHEPWQLYLLWGVVVGLTTGSTATVLAAMVANRWFIARRGLVTGLLTAGNATGQLIFLPLLASLVVTFGWRSAPSQRLLHWQSRRRSCWCSCVTDLSR
jgi:MFS family permease